MELLQLPVNEVILSLEWFISCQHRKSARCPFAIHSSKNTFSENLLPHIILTSHICCINCQFIENLYSYKIYASLRFYSSRLSKLYFKIMYLEHLKFKKLAKLLTHEGCGFLGFDTSNILKQHAAYIFKVEGLVHSEP